MGKVFKSKLKTPFEVAIGLIALVAIVGGIYMFAPGLRSKDNVNVDELTISKEALDNAMPTDHLPLPSTTPSLDARNFHPLVRGAGYAWNGETGIITATGGPRTTKGSLMEAYGVNLELTRQDWLSELRDMQLKFVQEFDGGTNFPTSDKAAAFIMIMGDGGPYFESTTNKMLDEKYGAGKYRVKAVAPIGMSLGEDKVIAPAEWKNDPRLAIGKTISVVIGDGDWVTFLNWCGVNQLPVNPDVGSYDPDAVNVHPSADDDYIKSAEELISSQLQGVTYPKREKKDGEYTGRTVNVPIDFCGTWTPGDVKVFDALTGFTDIASTADYPNQMATTLFFVEQWVDKNPQIVQNILAATYTATNQIKQFEDWQVHGGKCVAKTFGIEDGDYWTRMFKGETKTKAGVTYNIGGSSVLNYNDALQYYGEGPDNTDRYEIIWNQVSNYIRVNDPMDFNSSVGNVTPYSDAVDKQFLLAIRDKVQTTEFQSTDYSQTNSTVLADGNWNIQFDNGKSSIKKSSLDEMEEIYNLLQISEQAKVEIIGHTDNTGNPNFNQNLSEKRAESVYSWLENRGIEFDRFQKVEGHGQNEPLVPNTSALNKAKNRRVQVRLMVN